MSFRTPIGTSSITAIGLARDAVGNPVVVGDDWLDVGMLERLRWIAGLVGVDSS
jgi:hypothetical protein